MAHVTTWTLPIGQASFTPITLPDGNNRTVYFACQSGGLVGALETETGKAQTWAVPHDYWLPEQNAGTIWGLAAHKGHIWVSLENRLVRFTPGTGAQPALVSSFFSGETSLQTSPFPNVKSLALDGNGLLWFACDAHPLGPNAGSIGCFDPAKNRTTFWDLPATIGRTPCVWVVADIWPEADSRGVWFTVTQTNNGTADAFLAHVEVASDQLACWSPAQPAQPYGGGLVGDAPVNPANVWFVVDAGVYRLDVAANAVSRYDPPPRYAFTPQKIAVGPQGHIWVGQNTGLLTQVASGPGTPLAFVRLTTTLTRKTAQGGLTEAIARPTQYHVPFTSTTVAPQHPRHSQFLDYVMPLPSGNGVGVVAIDPTKTPAKIWFSQLAGQTIGVMTL